MNKQLQIVFLCLSIFLICQATETQTETESQDLHKTFEKALENNQNPSVENLLQLKNLKGQVYLIDQIYQSILELKTNVENDKQALKIMVNNDNQKSQSSIEEKSVKLRILNGQLVVLQQKLIALQDERLKISNIYTQDNQNYIERRTKQTELQNYINELIIQINNLKFEQIAQTLLQENVFAELKNKGKGNPIFAMVQLAKIFNEGDREKLFQHLNALKNAVQETLRLDQEKENSNLSLYQNLTNSLDNILIPTTIRQIKEIQDLIVILEAEIAKLNERIKIVNKEQEYADGLRDRVLGNTKQALSLTETNKENLSKAEIIITRK
ncbi:hypothetical protein IMG5_124910 [Ichthyophthirius multifiliis]|uniref:Uncharacterized protein n=1 Tax=Ichthyophthirius multifiliis TaxID=5932 RepID=G0QVN7_ICHMU|nr:hypothetical protein IMG5_124910 [Ichthyophthirius multifiliis]EGR30724.1 hypothetical protein IMG5_124910 [Ichthyophthirius multifiliis]|eukprot:XP_004032311.1 hypothetical protein IMG5_124910 [Ichthyophthirius multifiliis]